MNSERPTFVMTCVPHNTSMTTKVRNNYRVEEIRRHWHQLHSAKLRFGRLLSLWTTSLRKMQTTEPRRRIILRRFCHKRSTVQCFTRDEKPLFKHSQINRACSGCIWHVVWFSWCSLIIWCQQSHRKKQHITKDDSFVRCFPAILVKKRKRPKKDAPFFFYFPPEPFGDTRNATERETVYPVVRINVNGFGF